MKTYVYVTTSFEGFHQWRHAPEEVAFLRDLHRHIFGVKVKVVVSHSDRDVEFFMLKKDVEGVIDILKARLKTETGKSCEMMASEIYEDLRQFQYTIAQVEVNEDGENGAILKIKN